MRFRYRLLGVVLVCMITFVMFANDYYQTNIKTNDVEEEVTTVQKETIHFWYTDEGMRDYINNAAVMFEEKNGVRVFPELVSDDNAYVESIKDKRDKNVKFFNIRLLLTNFHAQTIPAPILHIY